MESAEYVVRYNYDLHVEAGIGDVVDTISLLRDVQDQILLAVAVELLNGCQEPLRRLENENSSNATSTVANFLEVSLKPLDIMLSPSGKYPLKILYYIHFSSLKSDDERTILDLFPS